MSASANLEDVPSEDLVKELLRRLKCQPKPDKRPILENARFKETKLRVAIEQYETFQMLDGESIEQMYIRFSDIMNEINGMGTEHSNKEMAMKIMRALPKRWKEYTTIIRMTQDLSNLSSEQLFSELKADEYELNWQNPAEPTKTEEESTATKDLSEIDEELNLLSRKLDKLGLRLKKSMRVHGVTESVKSRLEAFRQAD